MGRSEAEDTLAIISHGVEISIAGGAADKKDEGDRGLFFFYSLCHIFVVKVQEIIWSATYGENRTQQSKTNKQRQYPSSIICIRVRTGPWPTCWREDHNK